MSKKYDFTKIERKWQRKWLEERTYEPSFAKGLRTGKPNLKSASGRSKKPFYNLMMFPYPSAEGLHVGNMYAFTGADIYGRFKRMQGNDVFEPIGLDGFGIHSENYALKIGTHPAKQSKISEKRFYKQLASIGNGFAWNEHLETYAPEYYKWTQWIFAEMFKKGLAYRKKQAVNWCPSCKTVLADEQVINNSKVKSQNVKLQGKIQNEENKVGGGVCERCGAEVFKKELEQWFFRITKYADRLLADLKNLDWSERVKIAQENWIGKSEGAEIEFRIKNKELGIKRFVLLHGKGGHLDRNFFMWLKGELEGQGYEVVVPILPGAGAPNDDEQADYVIKNCKLDEQTAILGYSFGGIVALRVLERGVKLGKVVLVATPSSGDFLDKKDRPTVTEAALKGFKFDVIKKNCSFFDVLVDLGDTVVPFSDGEFLASRFGVPLTKTFAKEPHFCAKEEPAILDALLPSIKVFTTRPDTLFGATYLVLAPENKWLEQEIRNPKSEILNKSEVQKYIEKVKEKSEEERISEGRGKTGVELKGVKAINPANDEEIPIWVADYVLGSYGTGAIMAVPAHDERDFEFAKKFNLSVREVVVPDFGEVRSNEQYVQGVTVIGYDKASNKFLGLKWKDKATWLVGGGKEGDESFEDAARRELAEETGYKDIINLISLGSLYSHNYNDKKNINRSSFAVNFLAILDRNKQGKSNLETHEDFTFEWYDIKTLREEIRKVGGGVEHWLEVLNRAEKAIALYEVGKIYEPQGYVDAGAMINSGKFDGMNSEKAKWEIAKFVGGERKIQYRLRDWLISRQRYWGPPIPMIYCENCAKAGKGDQKEMPGWYAVLEKDLPVKLPIVKDFRPRGTGESPLASVKSFYEVKCPKCKEKARRETDVSDTFLDSAWYYLGYLALGIKNLKIKNQNDDLKFKSRKSIFEVNRSIFKKWLPIDLYTGGAEHSVLHLLYVRFLAKVFHDWGLVNFDEPAKKFRAHGLLIKDGAKMSKSKGNVINPDEYIEKFGADTLRMYLMFLAPFEQGGDFRDSGILGVERFLQRVWRLFEKLDVRSKTLDNESKDFERLLNKTIKKVTEDIETLNYNTAVSAMMILLNEVEKHEKLSVESYKIFVKLLAPFAPHMAEEIWKGVLGNKKSIHVSGWPKYDSKLIKDEKFTLVIQINGRVRDSVEVEVGITQAEAEKLVFAREKVKEQLQGTKPKKIVFVPGRLISIVV